MLQITATHRGASWAANTGGRVKAVEEGGVLVLRKCLNIGRAGAHASAILAVVLIVAPSNTKLINQQQSNGSAVCVSPALVVRQHDQDIRGRICSHAGVFGSIIACHGTRS